MGEMAALTRIEERPALKRLDVVPATVAEAGDQASYHYLEFLTAQIPNPNTRKAYRLALRDFFRWCALRGVALRAISPITVAAYLKQHPASPPTIKQHLAAIRQMLGHLAASGVLPVNPAASVKGPKYVTREGKTPVLSATEARRLLDAIPTDTLIGLRDRAMIGVMVYTFARVGALVAITVEDYFESRGRRHLRLHEKGGKVITVALNMHAAEYLQAWLEAADIGAHRKSPLFRAIQYGQLRPQAPAPQDLWARVKRYANAAGLAADVSNHSFRATGITVYLENGGTLEKAQYMAGHAKPETTKLYDRRREMETAGEVDKILI